MMRQNILNAMNQTYKHFIHSVNITLDDDAQTRDLSPLYEDLLHPNLIVNYSENAKYGFSHFNNMNCIRFVPDYENYDVYIKMDDDDIYKSEYVENIVNHFKDHPDTDIVSTKISTQLNGYDLYKGSYDNLGGNPNNSTYHMPMTFAFNNRAFKHIIDLGIRDVNGHDDMMWRTAWEKHNLVHRAVQNDDEIIWHIHGKNSSIPNFYINKT
jgi:hypothetical protein